MPTEQQQWAAFLALVPYFWACPGPLKMRTRLLTFLQQCRELTLTRDILLLQAGLSFFADDVEVDLALMQLVREGLLLPVAEAPFTFVIRVPHAKGADRGTPSP